MSDIFDTLVNDSPRQYGPSRHLSLRPGRRCWTASPSMDICLPTIGMESENPWAIFCQIHEIVVFTANLHV